MARPRSPRMKCVLKLVGNRFFDYGIGGYYEKNTSDEFCRQPVSGTRHLWSCRCRCRLGGARSDDAGAIQFRISVDHSRDLSRSTGRTRPFSPMPRCISRRRQTCSPACAILIISRTAMDSSMSCPASRTRPLGLLRPRRCAFDALSRHLRSGQAAVRPDRVQSHRVKGNGMGLQRLADASLHR